MKRFMKWLIFAVMTLAVATTYVYVNTEKLQNIFPIFLPWKKNDSSIENTYKIEHLIDAKSTNTVAGNLSIEQEKDEDSIDRHVYKLGEKRLLMSSFDYLSLNEKIDSELETIIISKGSSGVFEGVDIIVITKDGSYRDLSNSFGSNSGGTPKVSTDGKKITFEFETSDKYAVGQDIWTYAHGVVSGPIKNIKPKYNFDVNKLSKLKTSVSQKIDAKVISDEHGNLILKTKNYVIEPCHEEVFDTFTFDTDVTPPAKDSEGVFDAVIECNGSVAENYGPKITAISMPFIGPFAIKNIRLGMTLEELDPYTASGSIDCPEGKRGEVGIQDVRLCAIGWNSHPPEKHIELADTVAGLRVNRTSLLFYKKTLYAALIDLSWGNNRQIQELGDALVVKFGSPADKLATVKGIAIPPTFQSYTDEEGHKAYNSSMWTSSNGQLLFVGAVGVFPISDYRIGQMDIERNNSYKTFMNSHYDPNNPPQSVIITMVDRTTVEMIADQAEKDEQESEAKSHQEFMQKQIDELEKIREQAKQNALSL